MLLVIVFLFLGFFVSGDKESQTYYQIQMHRIGKDTLFRSSDNSPLPGKCKKEFRGLSYFPIDLKYRFQLPLLKHEKGQTIKIITSAGTEREALKYGYFEFEMGGMKCRLQVYKLLDVQNNYPNHFFVPFIDNTTDKESYLGGRYVDLVENDTGNYILDFNMAYNPYCAYGKEGYVCPLAPAENKLEVEIRAGEKNYIKGDP